MAYDIGLIAWTREALEPLGTVTHRPMMGAAILYCDGTVFALVDEEAIYFKADKVSAATWDAAGCPPFTFRGKDGVVTPLGYRRAPDEVYDDPDAIREWAMLGIEAGRRAPVKKKRKPG